MLLAITIALLVIAVVFSMYHTTTRVIDSQTAIQDGPASAARAMEWIVRDLNCAFISAESPECGFSLGPPESGNSDELHLRFCTTGQPSERDLRWFELEHVLYRFRTGSDRNGTLSREHVPMAGPGSESPATTNILATRIEQLEVEAFDGQDWITEWTAGGLPLGARLTMTSDGRTYTAEVFIPSANLVTSSLIRAATPAP